MGVAATAIGAAVVAGYVWFIPEKPQPRQPLPDLAQLNEDSDESVMPPNPGYLGPLACAGCHSSRVSEFLKTTHARACRRPQEGPMPPGFESGKDGYRTFDPELRFEMSREGGEFFQTAVRQVDGAERRTQSRIDLVYGANRADEVFFTWRGDRLHELMAVWLHPSNEWANSAYNRYGTGGFARVTTSRCLECHNTWFAHMPGTPNEYKPDSFVLGATCEKCHGPGSQHVRYHQGHPNDKAAHAITNPSQLSRERLIEVCTQCHGNFVKPRGLTNTYRPGEPLDKYYRVAEITNPEDDHVANQIKYLRDSKCFQKSDSMTCVTCHDPHRPHEKAAAASHASCLKCHQAESCSDRANLPVAVRDDCVDCHMRQQVWMNVHFHTAQERFVPPIRRFQHRIGVDPIARSEVLLGWHRSQTGPEHRQMAERLASELAEHWVKESERCRHNYRFLAAIGAAREALSVDPPPAVRARAEAARREAIGLQTDLNAEFIEAMHAADEQKAGKAIGILNKILTIKPDFAIAHGKLGTLYAATGKTDEAVRHLEAVARYDPDNASGLAMLGWLAYLGGRPADAIQHYRQAEKIEPFDAKINYHWGLALIKLENWAEAADRFRRALAVDPNHAGSSQGLAHALKQQGKAAEAVRYAWRAARLTDFRELDVLVTLAECYADAGRNPEAAAAAVRALELDAAGSGTLGLDTRRRLEVLRTSAAR
jgi:tetratricopeptide (TPR) repeat protein